MVILMSTHKSKRILALVEGEKPDVSLMSNLLCVYSIDSKFEIIPYGTNIYALYKEMSSYGDFGTDRLDILLVLKSREKDPARKELLEGRFTDIILIFDLDPQDPLYNAEHIKLMQEFFNDSSDTGKLYLNYPMVEAFYHMASIPDNDYLSRRASITELTERTYKARVNKETKGNDYRKFAVTKDDYTKVILQNLSKAVYIVTGEALGWQVLLKTVHSIELYAVLEKQLSFLNNDGFIYVLCTCVFYILDHDSKLLLSETANKL